MFCINNINFWYFIGTLYLLLLTYKDIKNKMLVDDRHNYMMNGLTLSLVFILKRKILYILLVLIIIILVGYIWKRFKALGDADIHSLGWIFYGYSVINLQYLITFSIIFIIILILYNILKLFILKTKKPTPFYIVILLSFAINNIILGLYV